MLYNNPIILSDYSDPDCIRVGDCYYMVASSFNHTPGIPVLMSKNLVNWKIIGYVFDEIPFQRFKDVCHGDGAWAPSLRYYNNKFYCIIPFPDEGIYVSECSDIKEGNWSKLWCLIDAKGIIDPCPIWVNDKCYLAVAFAKSRIGFNSMIGVYEVSTDLKKNISKDYKIVFDGHNTQPTIEGPKFYKHGDYFYILAPAGSVKTGWQTALRSKNIYGPYEEKIVMLTNDSKIYGPHQGALVDIGKDKYAFIHFVDLYQYGRVVYLEPVSWINDWPIIGDIKDELLGGSPVKSHEYLIDKKSNYKIDSSDDFKGDKLSYIWQTPANKNNNWYMLDNGLRLNCYYHNNESFEALNMCPNLFLNKILYYSFTVNTKVELNLKNDYDEVGLCYMGNLYSYIGIRRINDKNHLIICEGKINEKDRIIYDEIYESSEAIFNLKYIKPDTYYLGINNKYFKFKFMASYGRWIGGKYGIYARGNNKSDGYATFKYYKVREKNEK